MIRLGKQPQRWAVLLGALFVVGSVNAQEQSDDQQESDKLIEEVIVTATFRETNVQETPLAITAITGDTLEARAQSNIFQVTAQSPNVTLKPGGQARSGMLAYIRGVGQSDFIAALEPGVGIYVDDVYYAQLTGSLLDLLDISRVEVLRGPQGTLSGRNSIGGAIKMYTKKPGDGGEFIRVGGGSFNQVDVRGTMDMTLVKDTLWARVSGAAKTRDGYVKVLDYGCSHPGSGFPTNRGANDCQLGTEGDVDYTTGRVAVRWAASDDVEVNVIGDYLNDRSGTAPGVATYADRRAMEATGLFASITLPGTNGPLYYYDNLFVPYGPYHNPSDPINDPYVTYSTIADYGEQYLAAGVPSLTLPVSWKPTVLPSRNYIKQWGLSARVDWTINDNMSFLWLSAYREYNTWSTWDEDASPFAINMLDNKLDNYQFTQEIRLNGTAGPVDYTVGAFYLKQNSHYRARVDLNYALIDFLHGPDPTPADTKAVFANGEWHLTDRLNLSAGVRYSKEYKGYTHFRHNPDGSDVGSFGPTFPGAPDLINIRLTGVNGLHADFSDSRTDYRVAADFAVTDNMMVYGTVSTGYKGGGVNPRPFFPQQLQTFNPETLTSYEVGFKSTLLDQTLQFNAAAFYTDYSDIQLILTQCEVPTFIDPDGIGPPCLKPSNVGDAHIKGIELEAHWYATDSLLIDAMASFLNFDYTRVNPLALQGSSIPSLDMITPHTPETKWNLGIQYEFGMTGLGQLTVRADGWYQSKTYADATNSTLNQIDAYTLLNLVAWWDSPDSDWRLQLEVQNATDEIYYYDKYDQSGFGSVGSVLAYPGLPRTFNFSFTRYF